MDSIGSHAVVTLPTLRHVFAAGRRVPSHARSIALAQQTKHDDSANEINAIHGAATLPCMNTTLLHSSSSSSSSLATARTGFGRLASPLCWIAVGFASACACFASPGVAWQAGGQASAMAVQDVRSSGGAQTQASPIVAVSPEVEGPGGPGADDNTEWMPGNR